MKKELIIIGLIVLFAISLLTSCMSSSTSCGDSMLMLIRNDDSQLKKNKEKSEMLFVQKEPQELKF